MWHEIVAQLQSDKRAERIAGWNAVKAGCAPGQPGFTTGRRRALGEYYLDEPDEDVARLAAAVLFFIQAEPPPAGTAAARAEQLSDRSTLAAPAEQPAVGPTPRLLVDWLWQDFRRRGLVLRASCPPYQRDESTLFILGRHLSGAAYPDVSCRPVLLERPDWGHILEPAPDALCVIGRIGLYGAEARHWWSPPHPTFVFAREDRPPDLAPGRISPAYHCIQERLPDGSVESYVTREDEPPTRRTDYAIVQRYLVDDGLHQLTLVNCAGASALGTMGAVIWATQHLSRPTQAGGPIPLPARAKTPRHLEALLEVAADITGQEWAQPHIEPVKLYLDDYGWSKARHDWLLRAPSYIRIEEQPDGVVSLLLDGKDPNMDHDGEAFRLLVSLCRHHSTGGEAGVDRQRLLDDEWIWGGEPASEERLHNRLKQIRNRYLRESLTIGPTVQLHARVEVLAAEAASRSAPTREQPDEAGAVPLPQARRRRNLARPR
jgi:hypothetical protein